MSVKKIWGLSDVKKGWNKFSHSKKLKVLDKLISLQREWKIS